MKSECLLQTFFRGGGGGGKQKNTPAQNVCLYRGNIEPT